MILTDSIVPRVTTLIVSNLGPCGNILVSRIGKASDPTRIKTSFQNLTRSIPPASEANTFTDILRSIRLKAVWL